MADSGIKVLTEQEHRTSLVLPDTDKDRKKKGKVMTHRPLKHAEKLKSLLKESVAQSSIMASMCVII